MTERKSTGKIIIETEVDWFHGKNIQQPEKKEEPKPVEPSHESVHLNKLLDQLSEKVKSKRSKGGDSNEG